MSDKRTSEMSALILRPIRLRLKINALRQRVNYSPLWIIQYFLIYFINVGIFFASCTEKIVF